MTNAPPIAAPLCCPTGGGGDWLPLLVVVAALLAAHALIQIFKRRNGKPEMNNLKNLAIVAAVVVAAAAVFALKQRQAPATEATPPPATETTAAPAASAIPSAETSAPLPRLLELGADKCIPCKMMAPILDELRQEFAGQLQVDFIDVWKNPGAGDQYGVRVIPLQIFFAADGKELFRHEGFFAKADILAKWTELGVELQPKAAP